MDQHLRTCTAPGALRAGLTYHRNLPVSGIGPVAAMVCSAGATTADRARWGPGTSSGP